MAISSVNNRSFPGVTIGSEMPGKGAGKQANETGAVKNRETLPPVADKFEAGQVAFSNSSVQTARPSVVDQLKGASSFEDCAPEPAVALTLPDGAVVGADLIDIKGGSKDSTGVGKNADGQDCSPPTIGQVGVDI